MLVPVKAVHDAALALSNREYSITQTMFEDAYHCRLGMSTDNDNYWLDFDNQEYATMFILRWA